MRHARFSNLMMDRDYIDRNDLVRRYVTGDLLEEEAAEFEDYFLSDQAIIEEIALMETLLSNDKTTSQRNESESNHVSNHASAIWRLAAAAAGGAILTGVAMNPGNSVVDIHLPSDPRLVYVESIRSGTGSEAIANSGQIVFLVIEGVPPVGELPNHYDLILQTMDGKEVARSEGHDSDGLGQVNWLLKAPPPEEYTLLLKNEGLDVVVAEYTVRFD